MKSPLPIRLIFASSVLSASMAWAQTAGDALSQARSLLSANNIPQAETALRSYLADHPDSADAHFLLGYVLFRERKAKDSLAEFTAGARYREPHADEFKVVASDYVILRGFSDADKWFTRALSEQPDDVQTWYLLGRTKFTETEFAGAISDFEHALSLRPKYIEAENNIGLCWRELGNLDKAKEAFRTAIAWQGDAPTDAQPYFNLGTLLAEANQQADALPYLEQAAKLSPENPSIHEKLGKAYVILEKLPEARTELEKAASLAPNVSSLHFQLGQVDRRLGFMDKAQQEFAICKQLSTTHSSAKTPNPFNADPTR